MRTFFVFQDNPLVSVLASRGAELIDVMVGVLGFLARSNTADEARSALSSTSVLIKVLLPHLGQKLRGKSTYIISTLVHTLTYYTIRLQELASYLAGWLICFLLNYRYTNGHIIINVALPLNMMTTTPAPLSWKQEADAGFAFDQLLA